MMVDKESLIKEERVLAVKKGKLKQAIRNLIVEKNLLVTEIGSWYLQSRNNEVSASDLEVKFVDVTRSIELVDKNIALKITEKKNVYSELKEIEIKLEDLS